MIRGKSENERMAKRIKIERCLKYIYLFKI